MRLLAVPVVITLAVGACGGDERQDAGAPAGEFAVDVMRATFPQRQSLAQASVLRLDVRNAGARAVPDLAVTVETAAGAARRHPAFASAVGGARLDDPARPVWVLDRGPEGGRTAYAGTWAFGALARGATRTVRFVVTAARPGRYRLRWRVAPALEGDVRLAPGSRTSGAFPVVISDAPVDSRVGRRGSIVRGGRS
jgi:hypothetical protein